MRQNQSLVFDRHQLVPLKIQDESITFDLILEFFHKYISENKNLPQNEKIEIEAKLGEIRYENQKETKQLMHQLSFQNYLISNFQNQRFISEVDEQLFQTNVVYLKQIAKAVKQLKTNNFSKDKIEQNYLLKFIKEQFKQEAFFNTNIDSAKEQYTVDFIFVYPQDQEKNCRISYILKDQSFIFIKKQRIEDMNIIHNGISYRISASKETTKSEQNIQQFIQDNISNLTDIRIKIRNSLLYEFMQYDLTKSCLLKKQIHSGIFDDIFKYINLQLYDSLNNYLISFLNNENFLFKNEIELEIVDINYLITFLDNKPAFNSLVKRFLRNIESFSQTKQFFGIQNIVKSLIQKVQEQNVDRVPPQIIGEYMQIEALNYLSKMQIKE